MLKTWHNIIDYFRWGCTPRDRVSYLVFTIGMLAALHATFIYGGIYATFIYRYEQITEEHNNVWNTLKTVDPEFDYEENFGHVSLMDHTLATDIHRLLMVRRALYHWRPQTQEERNAHFHYNEWYKEQYEHVEDERLGLFLERQLKQENI